MDKKTLLFIVMGILLVSSFLVVKNIGNPSGNIIIKEDIENLHKTNLEIKDMYCEACSFGVKAQIEGLEGVVSEDIDFKTAKGIVLYDADKVDYQTIADASTVYPASVVDDEKVN